MMHMSTMRFVSIVTATNVLVASGFAVAGLVDPKLVVPGSEQLTNASSVFAMYGAARTLPLAAFVLIAIWRRCAPALILLGALAGVIQLMDTAIGVYQADAGKALGPLLIGVVQLASVLLLKNSAKNEELD